MEARGERRGVIRSLRMAESGIGGGEWGEWRGGEGGERGGEGGFDDVFSPLIQTEAVNLPNYMYHYLPTHTYIDGRMGKPKKRRGGGLVL